MRYEFNHKFLKRVMDDLRYDQMELAKKTKISQGAISKYISGKSTPNFDCLIRISKAIGVPAEDLAVRRKS